MKKIIEFGLEKEELKKYLEECLTEENINFQIKIEDRWTEQYKNASEYYKVYCLYVNDNFDKVEQFIKDFENAKIISDDVEELKYAEEEEEKDNRFKIFTIKNFVKYFYIALLIIAIIIIIAAKLSE